MLIFSVRDSKANFYAPPFLSRTKYEATRGLQQLVQDTSSQKNQIAQFPEDFDLYQIGEFDEQTGKITPLDAPQHIEKAVLLKTQG